MNTKKQLGIAPIAIFLIIVGVLVLGGGAYWWQKDNINKLIFGEISKACTQEAKLCPNGSSVGRTGPNCEFAECPREKDKNTNLGTQQDQEKAQRLERDFQRIEDIKNLQVALELYFDENNEYPNTLTKLIPKFLANLPFDPFNKKSYYYSVHISDGAGQVQKGRPDSYHLGANLEEQENALKYDKDCNSIVGLNCSYKTGFERSTAFNGSDDKGCGGEIKRYCYDLTP